MDTLHFEENVSESGILKKSKSSSTKKYKYYRPLTEQVMVDRMSRRESITEREITYELTRDPGFLHQYYILRESMFINVWGLKSFSGREDTHDRYSNILIARQGNHVVGGIRITTKSQRPLRKLPMEHDDFILEKVVPDLNLKECRYGEKSRFAILSDLRNKDTSVQLTGHAVRKCTEMGLKYVFAICPYSLARSYRMLAIVHHLDSYIRDDVVIPDREEFEGIPMALLVFDYTKLINQYLESKSDINLPSAYEELI